MNRQQFLRLAGIAAAGSALAAAHIACGGPSGYDPATYVVEATAAWKGIKAAYDQAPGTWILTKDNLVMFAWSNDRIQMAFAVIDQYTGKPISNWAAVAGSGQKLSIFSFSELLDFLRGEAGWTSSPPNALSPELRAEIASMGTGTWIGLASRMWPTFVWTYPDMLRQDKFFPALETSSD